MRIPAQDLRQTIQHASHQGFHHARLLLNFYATHDNNGIWQFAVLISVNVVMKIPPIFSPGKA